MRYVTFDTCALTQQIDYRSRRLSRAVAAQHPPAYFAAIQPQDPRSVPGIYAEPISSAHNHLIAIIEAKLLHDRTHIDIDALRRRKSP